MIQKMFYDIPVISKIKVFNCVVPPATRIEQTAFPEHDIPIQVDNYNIYIVQNK